MVRVLLPIPPQPPETLRVDGERFHYLAHVLRLSPGEALEVFDGAGRAFAARVETVAEDMAVLSIGAALPGARARRSITVVQGLPKADKLEWILQKGTELGAAAFAPVATARSVVKLAAERAAERQKRWARIVEEAARQCGRSDVPAVHPPRPLLEAVRALPPGTRVLVLDEEETRTRLTSAVAGLGELSPLALVIGPEGGLERGEVDALRALSAQPVTLGGRVLRTETASLAALAVLLHLDGELG
ncbi:MAG: 16S rRNA (uracil(1498)-N(3))-methyltransferase [Myxococcaceae bacterium]